MQNKPNSLNVQIYINTYDRKDYKNSILLAGYKNKPNSNPIKPNFFKSPNEYKFAYNKGLQKKRCFRIPKKQTQLPKSLKMNVSAFLQKDYENEPPSYSNKTNPNKANLRSNDCKLLCYGVL
jgi:hypothetical protein